MSQYPGHATYNNNGPHGIQGQIRILVLAMKINKKALDMLTLQFSSFNINIIETNMAICGWLGL